MSSIGPENIGQPDKPLTSSTEGTPEERNKTGEAASMALPPPPKNPPPPPPRLRSGKITPLDEDENVQKQEDRGPDKVAANIIRGKPKTKPSRIRESVDSIQRSITHLLGIDKKSHLHDKSYRDIKECLGESAAKKLVEKFKGNKKVLSFFSKKDFEIYNTFPNLKITNFEEKGLDLESLEKLPLSKLREELGKKELLPKENSSVTIKSNLEKIELKYLIKLEPFIKGNPLLREACDRAIKDKRLGKKFNKSEDPNKTSIYFVRYYNEIIDDSNDRSLYDKVNSNKQLKLALGNIGRYVEEENGSEINIKDALQHLKHKDVPLMQELAKNCTDEQIKNLLLERSFEINADYALDSKAFLKKHLKGILKPGLKKSVTSRLVEGFKHNNKIVTLLKDHLFVSEKLKYEGKNPSSENKENHILERSQNDLTHEDKRYLKALIDNLPEKSSFRTQLKQLLNDKMYSSVEYTDIELVFEDVNSILRESTKDLEGQIKTLTLARQRGDDLLKKISIFENFTFAQQYDAKAEKDPTSNYSKEKDLSKHKNTIANLLFLDLNGKHSRKENEAKKSFQNSSTRKLSLRPKTPELKTFVYSFVQSMVREHGIDLKSETGPEDLAALVQDFVEVSEEVKNKNSVNPFKKPKQLPVIPSKPNEIETLTSNQDGEDDDTETLTSTQDSEEIVDPYELYSIEEGEEGEEEES